MFETSGPIGETLVGYERDQIYKKLPHLYEEPTMMVFQPIHTKDVISRWDSGVAWMLKRKNSYEHHPPRCSGSVPIYFWLSLCVLVASDQRPSMRNHEAHTGACARIHTLLHHKDYHDLMRRYTEIQIKFFRQIFEHHVMC